METTQAAPHRTRNAPHRLLDQHARIDALLRRLLDEAECDARPALEDTWAELEPMLLSHLAAEELYLFPALAKENTGEVETLAAEHREFRERIAEIGIGIELRIIRFDAIRELADALRSHAEREDRVLYPWAVSSDAPGARAFMAKVGRAIALAVRHGEKTTDAGA